MNIPKYDVRDLAPELRDSISRLSEPELNQLAIAFSLPPAGLPDCALRKWAHGAILAEKRQRESIPAEPPALDFHGWSVADHMAAVLLAHCFCWSATSARIEAVFKLLGAVALGSLTGLVDALARRAGVAPDAPINYTEVCCEQN